MGSKSSRTWHFMVPILLFACHACKAGMPPEPPEHDAANADAKATEYQAPPNFYQTSAFTGEDLSTATEHEHHHHKRKHSE